MPQDYAALARQFGGTVAQPPPVDYDALAKQSSRVFSSAIGPSAEATLAAAAGSLMTLAEKRVPGVGSPLWAPSPVPMPFVEPVGEGLAPNLSRSLITKAGPVQSVPFGAHPLDIPVQGVQQAAQGVGQLASIPLDVLGPAREALARVGTGGPAGILALHEQRVPADFWRVVAEHAMAGASDVMGGVGKAATPMVAGGLAGGAAAAVKTGLTLAAVVAGQAGAERGSLALGASPVMARFVGDLVGTALAFGGAKSVVESAGKGAKATVKAVVGEPVPLETRAALKSLGVDRVAGMDPTALRAAYRQRARATHPDVNLTDPEAAAKFQAVKDAYMWLADHPPPKPGLAAKWKTTLLGGFEKWLDPTSREVAVAPAPTRDRGIQVPASTTQAAPAPFNPPRIVRTEPLPEVPVVEPIVSVPSPTGGAVTLYRGGDKPGRWFTTDIVKARAYAGENGKIVSVNVPASYFKDLVEEARIADDKSTEQYFVDDETAARARPVKPVAPVSPAPAPAAPPLPAEAPVQTVTPPAPVEAPAGAGAAVAAPRLTYDQFAAAYEQAFKSAQQYKPSEVGSQIFTEKMAKLADEYPEHLARLETQLEAPQEPTHAIQEPSPAQVDVRPRAEGGRPVGEGNAAGQVAGARQAEPQAPG